MAKALRCAILKGSELNTLIDKTQFPVSFRHREAFADNDDLFCAFDGERVAGIVSLYVAPTNTAIKMFEVAKDMRHQGVATTMARALFELAERNDWLLTSDGALNDGRNYLRPLFDALLAEYPKRFERVPGG